MSFLHTGRGADIMKYFAILLFSFILLTGCGSKDADKPKTDETAKAPVEETETKAIPTLKELIAESKLDEQMLAACGDMKIEYIEAKLRAGDTQSAIVSICHHGGDVSLEGETAHIMVAMPVENSDEWDIQDIDQSEIVHPATFLGTIQNTDGSEIVIIEQYESPAAFGGRGFQYVYFDETPIIDTQFTQHTLSGDMTLDNGKVLVQDESVLETFTFEKGEFQHRSELKNLDNSANVVITYDKSAQGKLIFSEINFTTLDVKVGDRISFRRAKPIPLTDFQIRTNLTHEENNVDTFVVTEEMLGKTIEAGEYPYDASTMSTFIIGKGGQPDLLLHGYFDLLKTGIMPGSKIQLTDSNKNIEKTLGTPIETFGYAGANYLNYGKFAYAVPFLESEGEKIYGIARILDDSEKVNTMDLRSVWGEPTNEAIDELGDPALLTWTYEFSPEYRVRVSFDSDKWNANVTEFTLLRTYNE